MKCFDNFENKVFEKYYKLKIDSLIKKDFEPNEYTYFRTPKEIKKWKNNYNSYFEKTRDLKNNLLATKKQLQELEIFDYYAGYGSEKINRYLRNIPQFLMNKEYIKNQSIILERVIDQFSLEVNLISIRLMPSEFITKNYKKGESFLEKGFLSTSVNLNYRLDYQSKRRILKHTTLLIIKTPKGTKAVYTEKVQPECRQRKEYELIIQKNNKITIESNQKILSNRIIVLSIEQKPNTHTKKTNG